MDLGGEVLVITICAAKLVDCIRDWRGSKEPLGSDWKGYREELSSRIQVVPNNYRAKDRLEEVAE